MSKLDISTVYKDRIKQIDKDMEKAKKSKRWADFYKLKQEKDNLEHILTKK